MMHMTRQGLAITGTDADVQSLRRALSGTITYCGRTFSILTSFRSSCLSLRGRNTVPESMSEWDPEPLTERNMAVNVLFLLANNARLISLVQNDYRVRFYRLFPRAHV